MPTDEISDREHDNGTATFAVAYWAAVADLGGCPIELGAFGKLADLESDLECRCGRWACTDHPKETMPMTTSTNGASIDSAAPTAPEKPDTDANGDGQAKRVTAAIVAAAAERLREFTIAELAGELDGATADTLRQHIYRMRDAGRVEPFDDEKGRRRWRYTPEPAPGAPEPPPASTVEPDGALVEALDIINARLIPLQTARDAIEAVLTR